MDGAFLMDEHAEEQRELALLDRENQDDARELSDEQAHWHENAVDVFFRQTFQMLDDR